MSYCFITASYLAVSEKEETFTETETLKTCMIAALNEVIGDEKLKESIVSLVRRIRPPVVG